MQEWDDDQAEMMREMEDNEMALYKADEPVFWGDWYGYKKG
jgi:hypothetical protein